MPPLDGLRVLDLTGDAGRFATKLNREFGADVVRLTAAGSPGERLADPAAAARGGTLDWWYDGGKRRHLVDLDHDDGVAAYRAVAQRADLIVETTRPGLLADRGIDHADLLAANPRLVQVSITPFGRTGPRAGWQISDLVAAATGGVLSCTGLPDRPLNLWGRQNYNFASFNAVIAGLAAVRAADLDGKGRHVDVSVQEAVVSTVEQILFHYFYDEHLPRNERIAPRQGALHWLRVFDLAGCADGVMMITSSPGGRAIIEWMVDEGHEPAVPLLDIPVAELPQRIDDIMTAIRSFVAPRFRTELWEQAQTRRCALADVRSLAEVVDSPQHDHRHFFADVLAGETSVRMPARMTRMARGTVPPAPPADSETPLSEILDEWPARERPAPSVSDGPTARPLDGIRVADFSWVLAGPACTRMLGDLGADVVKVQHAPRASVVNQPQHPFYPTWNRSKRSASLNMAHPEAKELARRLVQQSDVVVENFSAGVFASWGLDWESMRALNPRLVYVTMSGCGHDGPWSHVLSYAPTVHALSGLAHLTNFSDRGDLGPGFSLGDHLAGYAAASAVLAALHERERTGEGQLVDLAQVEVSTYTAGPGIIEHFATESTPEPAGNRDGLHDHVPNEVYRASDGDFVAVTITDGPQWDALAAVVGPSLADPVLRSETVRRDRRADVDAAVAEWVAGRNSNAAMMELQAAGVPAGAVLDAAALFERDPQLAARDFWQSLENDAFGRRPADTFPALFDGRRINSPRAAPSYIGEQNFDVWDEVAGLDAEAVALGMATGLFE